jgi:hypothetical protein
LSSSSQNNLCRIMFYAAVMTRQVLGLVFLPLFFFKKIHKPLFGFTVSSFKPHCGGFDEFSVDPFVGKGWGWIYELPFEVFVNVFAIASSATPAGGRSSYHW